MGPKMPVSCENSESAISSSIRDSLVNYNSIAKASGSGISKNQLAASLKQSLLKAIEYVESPPGFGYSIQDSLKAKYTVLRPSEEEKTTTTAQSLGGSTQQLSKTGNGTKLNGACLPSPKLILFAREKLQIGWGNARKWSVGSGMVNLGNTCYLNSTLQALFHVPSFANWLLSDSDHRNRCEESTGSQNGCIICSMATVLQSTQSNQCPTKPGQVYSKLKQICRYLVLGQQEDAHEFLRYLMESMEKAYLARYKNSKDLEQYTKETTPINQILGGYLRTSVKCLSCQYESVTFQHFEDLLLDIRKWSTIDEALKHHFARERLEDMDYTCESCKKKVSATKQFSLERAPVTLCIQLKRFSGMNGKITKHITITQDLDISQYSSRDMKHSQLKYRLVSMITHVGSTPLCGHYTAIGCCQDGSYYQFDDSFVRAMSVHNLLNTNPYIIFYELMTPTKPLAMITASPAPKSSTVSVSHNENGSKRTESTQFIGPLLPVNNQLNKQPILSPINRPYGSSTSNGFADNRKLVTTISNNNISSLKKSTDTVTTPSSLSIGGVAKSTTTNGISSNEAATKNVNKIWTKVFDTLPGTVKTDHTVPESKAKRIADSTNSSSNETVTKKSLIEDSSDSESEFSSKSQSVSLPSMPELKSNSPTTLKNGDIARPVNDIESPEMSYGKRCSDSGNSSTPQRETVTTNGYLRKPHSPAKFNKGTVAVYISPAKNHHSPNNNHQNRKLVSLNHCESTENQNKGQSPTLPPARLTMVPENGNKVQSPTLPPVRLTMNPFDKSTSTPMKNGKHKTNGYGHHGVNAQRTTKPTNGYVVNPRKSLVPYLCHDDSDSNNEDRKSPPIVRTKAGPFQVTKNTTNGNSNNHRNVGDTRLTWPKSSNGGRVPSLNTWNGGTSTLQEEIIADQRENGKRKLEKDFDLDLDIGRMKKKRNNGRNGDRDNPKYNAFQELNRRPPRTQLEAHRRKYCNKNSNFRKMHAYSTNRKY